MKYEYKLDICKDVFIDRYNQVDVMQDCKNFFKRLKELKLYMVEFEEDSTMKLKIYPSDCTVRGDKWCSIIVITYDKYIFFTNNRIWKTWTWKRDIFLRSKGWG